MFDFLFMAGCYSIFGDVIWWLDAASVTSGLRCNIAVEAEIHMAEPAVSAGEGVVESLQVGVVEGSSAPEPFIGDIGFAIKVS